MSQPAISKHVASLEQELETQLVVRNRRGASLTPAGEVLADYVLRAEALLANGRRALAAGGDAQVGTLALAASGIPGTYLLPPILARFHEQHPAVELDFRVSTSGGALDLVRAHEAELALVGGMTVPPELESEPLVDDEVVLIGPPSLGGRRLRPKDLAEQTWISREEGSATREAVESARWQIGLRSVRTLELPSWEAVKLAVASGAGIAAISRFALDSELETRALAILDVPRWRLERTIAVLTARDVPLTPPAERFLELLRTRFLEPEEPASNSNLPAGLTPLVGRRRELEEVRSLIREGARIVTLTGAGGSGKTRLGLAAAAGLVDEFSDGVYLVELAPLADPELVVPTISQTLGLKQPEQLASDLRQRQLLLLLDNFERVLAAAPGVVDLVAAAPRLVVLATSRAPLHVSGEHEYPVEPLPIDDAQALFVARAREIDPQFEFDPSVSEICERLDRLPLAIELAASRVKTLRPAELLGLLGERLPLLVGGPRNAPERQRTLRRTIDWSYELLDESGQALLRRLAVFSGGFTLEAAEEVCGARLDELGALVDQSLLRRDERVDGAPRFMMLETIREYALDLLEGSGEEAEVRRLHADYFAAFAAKMSPTLHRPGRFDRLDQDRGNLRAALASLRDLGEVGLELRLAGTLSTFWAHRGPMSEGMMWLEDALARADERTPERVRALTGLAWLMRFQGDYRRHGALSEESLALARELGDVEGMGFALRDLATDAQERGDYEAAGRLLDESASVWRQLGAPIRLADVTHSAGYIAMTHGDYAEARARLEESVRLSREAGDTGIESGVALLDLGQLELLEGRQGKAAEIIRSSLRRLQENADVTYSLVCVAALAAIAAAKGDPIRAAKLLGAVEEKQHVMGADLLHDPVERDLHAQTSATVRAELATEQLEAARAEGRVMELDEAIAYALETTG